MPPGDRGPTLRIASARVLAALDAIESEPRLPGRDAIITRSRRIALRRAELRKLAILAERFAIALPPDVAERAAADRRTSSMTTEARSEALGAAILDAMRKAIEGGMSPVEAVDTGLMAVGSISIQADGGYRTGAKFIIVGEGLVDGSPEGAAKRGAGAKRGGH